MAGTAGGARPGAGRPKGVPNKVPSRARVAQEKLLEKLEPQLDLLVETALTILRDPNTKATDKNATLKLLLDFIAKTAAQDVVDAVVDAVGAPTVADLLTKRPLRDTPEGAPEQRAA